MAFGPLSSAHPACLGCSLEQVAFLRTATRTCALQREPGVFIPSSILWTLFPSLFPRVLAFSSACLFFTASALLSVAENDDELCSVKLYCDCVCFFLF